MNTPKPPDPSLNPFLKALANRVAQAKHRVEESEFELVKAQKGATYAESWWYEPYAISWMCQQYGLDAYALLDLSVERDDRLHEAYAKLA